MDGAQGAAEWVERPYVARHTDNSEARQFLQKYSSELKSKGRQIQKAAEQGNIDPFVQHVQSLKQNIQTGPLVQSAYDAAVEFNRKYNLPGAEAVPSTEYPQLLYHDAFQHGIPERLVGVVDKSAPRSLTAADEARATLLQMQQMHTKIGADPKHWYRMAQSINAPQSGFDLVSQEVRALRQQQPGMSEAELQQQSLARFPSLSKESLTTLREKLNTPYVSDLLVSENLTQASRLKAGLEKYASRLKNKPGSGVSTEMLQMTNEAFKQLPMY